MREILFRGKRTDSDEWVEGYYYPNKLAVPKEKLVEIFNQFFSMEDTDAYWLTRVKSAFAVGAVTIDDFEEFTDETINELANFVIEEIVCTANYINGIEVNQETIGQYTGLTDKNGKKIFEGDIVIIETTNVDEEDGNFIVEYDNGEARYVLNGETLTFDFDSIYSIEIEVIGNICDNPELLEADLNG